MNTRVAVKHKHLWETTNNSTRCLQCGVKRLKPASWKSNATKSKKGVKT